MKSYQEFFAELKRRKVFKVAGIYGIVAFGVLQAADLMLPRLGVPDWTVTFMVALVVLALPVALILAWAFEVTPDGVRKTAAANEAEIEAIIAEPASKRWPAGLLALIGVVALVAGAWWVGRATAPGDSLTSAKSTGARLAFVDPADDPRPSIAVLPFEDMSPDGDQAYFSDGMTEEILNVLAKIHDLRVSARTSTFALRDRELTAPQWGDTLGVGYLVEGSVRKAGEMVRITAQLIDTSDGSHLWSDNYDRPLANVFQIQSEIAEQIAAALAVPLGLSESESLTTPTADLEAYDLYLAGRQQMRSRGQGVREAVTLFEAAIARDSNWAPAWAGLAESRALVPYYTFARYSDSTVWVENLGAAEAAALRALELDSDNASALVALANVYRDRWEWERAEDTYLRAIATDPDNVEAHHQYAEYLYEVGRLVDAIKEAERALALDRSPIRLYVAGYIAVDAGKHDEGIALMEEGIRLDPDGRVFQLRAELPAAYFEAERWDDWWDWIINRRDETLDTAPDSIRALILEGWDDFLAVWPKGTPFPEDPDIEPGRLGPIGPTTVALRLGEYDAAVESLENRYGTRPPIGPPGALMLPRYDPLRDNPRFQALLEKRGLAGLVPQRLPPESGP